MPCNSKIFPDNGRRYNEFYHNSVLFFHDDRETCNDKIFPDTGTRQVHRLCFVSAAFVRAVNLEDRRPDKISDTPTP